jgi:hypothetical protein
MNLYCSTMAATAEECGVIGGRMWLLVVCIWRVCVNTPMMACTLKMTVLVMYVYYYDEASNIK